MDSSPIGLRKVEQMERSRSWLVSDRLRGRSGRRSVWPGEYESNANVFSKIAETGKDDYLERPHVA